MKGASRYKSCTWLAAQMQGLHRDVAASPRARRFWLDSLTDVEARLLRWILEAAAMRILIAEDDFASRILLEAVLVKWGYEVIAATDGQQAWELLKAETAPPIAILDWMMPKVSGLELCQLARAQTRELVPYILMLTAKGQKSDISSGLDAGADDYLVKPFDLVELGARLRVARRAIELQRELVDARKAVQYQMVHDVPTGALNRGAILAALAGKLSAGRPVIAAIVAVDNHKQLQEAEGAETAEAAVRGVVQLLRAHAPDAEIGRYGSDELLVLLDGSTLTDASALMEGIREQVCSEDFHAGIGVVRKLTASIGLAEWDRQASLELLLCYADTALYAARSSGNAVDVFGFQLDLPRSAE